MQNSHLYRVVRPLCAVLFALFTFCFLFFQQGEVLARAQFMYSHGLTSYSLWWGAVLIPIVLLLLQWVMAKVTPMPVRFHALTYFPSVLGLTVLTSVTEETMRHFSFLSWTWIAPLLLVLYIVVWYVVCRFTEVFSNEKGLAMSDVLWPNAFILLAMIIFCGSASNSKDVYHYELKTERLILEDHYDDALKVAEKEYVSSQRLTQLRMYALSEQGALSERLFDYPQYYGGKGLLDICSDDVPQRLDNRRIYVHLGICPDTKTIRNLGRFLALANANDSIRNLHTIDYELCYMLLERNLKGFTTLLPLYYAPEAMLPRAYAEAAVYVQMSDSMALRGYNIPADVVDRYWQYQVRKQEITDAVERTNRTRREFGNTFWWYYENETKEPDFHNP